MKCALVTIHDENYQFLSELTWDKNRSLYADKHGYGKIVQTNDFVDTSIGFSKIRLLLKTLYSSDYDILAWSGTDTLITNFHIPLTEFVYPGYHISIATDFNGIQSDSFVIRNTIETRSWLEMILNCQDQYKSHPFLEQGVMMETYQQCQHIIKLLPQRYLNSYYYPHYYSKGATSNNDSLGFSGNWQVGDFLLHSPDQPMNVRLELFNRTLPFVIK